MYILKKIIYFYPIIFCCLLIGCAASNAPSNYLPATTEIPQNPYGGWITIIAAPDSSMPDDNWLMYGGEFIASEDSVIYVLYDTLYAIPKQKITNSLLELDEKNTTIYGLWVVGGSLLTISNGAYAVFTLPLWLVAGIPAASGESIRDRYEAEYPDENYWEEIKVFARFPQGTTGINLRELIPYKIIEN